MSINELKENGLMVYEYVRGSVLYGLNTPASDIDGGGVFAYPVKERLSLRELSQEVHDKKGDVAFYELKKYLGLAATANPNILETLYIPENHIVSKNVGFYELLVGFRDKFITKKCQHSYSGYAYAQIKKAKGKNKKVNDYDKYINADGLKKIIDAYGGGKLGKDFVSDRFSPELWDYLCLKHNAPFVTGTMLDGMDMFLKDKDIVGMLKPTPLDYCVFVPYLNNGVDMPARPTVINCDMLCSKKYGVSSLEHFDNVYRVYYGNNYGGIFRGGQIVCSSIPKDKEIVDFIGLLKFNVDEYVKQLKAYRSFWEWMSMRNDKRWVDQDSGNKDYDQKNMMHTLRLLYEAEFIVKEGRPRVVFTGVERDFLMKVRNGEFEYDYLLGVAEEKTEGLTELFANSSLPYGVNDVEVNDLYLEMVETLNGRKLF